MPVFGRLDSDSVKNVATISKIAEERVDVEDTETLTLTFEVSAEGAFDTLPKAVHPPGPPYASFAVRRHKDSPVGAFTTVELRLHTRATGLYMGYVLGGYTDNKKAKDWLAAAYGSPIQLAEKVSLIKTHYGFEAKVVAKGGKLVLDALQQNPGYINGADVLYIPNLNLATYEGERVLVAEEFEYRTKEAKRGAAAYKVRDLAAFGGEKLIPTNELPSTYTTGTWAYENVRFVLDPKVPAQGGLKRVGKKKENA
jgi:hypothetical protein